MKIMKAINTSSGKFLRALTTVILTGLLATQFLAAQDWYDTDWLYRSSVAVTNPGSTVLTDFQVQIVLTDGVNFDCNRPLPDGSDIRVTSSDGTTLIPFWIGGWVAETPTRSDTIWVKMPEIPVSGTTVYIYYGNTFPTIPQTPVAKPPVGPYTKYTGNPITISGLSCQNQVLPENLVYDGGKYWVLISNRCINPCPLSLISSTDLITWVHEGIILSASDRYFDAPCLVKADNTWYIFYSNYNGSWSESNPAPIGIAKSTTGNIMGPYTELNRYILTCGTSPAWDDARVSEPYVIQRDNGDWVMVYMGDALPSGGFEEQIGIAVSATGIEGPYTKSSGNPVIPFGTAGSLDAGTVADPWVVKFGSTYYIGYTASPTKANWNTTYATTTDWSTFTKSNTVILEKGGSGAWDALSAFRGAVTRVGNTYIFPYTGQNSSPFQFGYATQPVYHTPPDIIDNVYAVFEFYDGFDSTAFNTAKWNIDAGGSAVVNSGILTVTTNGLVTVTGNKAFNKGMLLEALARHPNADGTGHTAAELGFGNTDRSYVFRILDYTGSYFLKNVGGVTYYNMATALDNANYLLHRIFWRSDTQVDFAMGDNTLEPVAITTTQNIPPWLFCYAASTAYTTRLMVDWIRVRKWVGSDAGATVSYPGQGLFIWDGSESTAWGTGDNWFGNTAPGSGDNISIPDVTNDPVVSGDLTINTEGSMTIQAGAALTVNGDLTTNNGLFIESSVSAGSGSLIVSGTPVGNVTYNRLLREGDDVGDKHLFSSPVYNQDITNFISTHASKIDNVRIHDEVSGGWANITAGPFYSGKGYSVYQTDNSDGAFSFTGQIVKTASMPATSPYMKSYADRVIIDATDPYGENHTNMVDGYWVSGRSYDIYGSGGWNLLGNPFTSAIDAAAFISTNAGDFDPHYQALYVYDGKNSVYKYAASVIPGYPPDYVQGGLFGNNIQAGQGFFVLANNNGVQFDFSSSMQVQNTGVAFLKSAGAEDEPWPGLMLKVRYGNKESQTLIAYNSDMTTGLDPGYDLGQLSTYPEVEVYTSLVQKDNSVNFARQVLPLTDSDKNIVPVGIDSEKGGEITFSAFTVPLGTNKFWIEDRTTGIFTNLNTSSYTVTLPAKTYGTGRFFIIASTNTPTGIEQPEAEDTGVRVWTSNDKVIIKGEVSDRAICDGI